MQSLSGQERARDDSVIWAWQKQEVFKGVNAAGSLSAGWGFHCWTTNINNETVSAMFNPTISDYDIADILAFHIPAVSSPAGKECS